MDHKANQQAKADALAAGWTEQDWRAEFRDWRARGIDPAAAAGIHREWERQTAVGGPALHNAVARGWDARA